MSKQQHHQHKHQFKSSIVKSPPGIVGGIGACVLAAALVACAFLVVSLLSAALAFAAGATDAADGGALGTAAVDSGWSLFEAYGPLWGSISIAYPLARHLLAVNESEHWIAGGRVLAFLTGAAAVLGTAIQWRFGGAPASGILAAAVGAIALIWHPTVSVKNAGRVASTLALAAAVALASSGSLSCAARQSVGAGVTAGLDCEAPGLVAFMGDATVLAIRMLEHWISGTGQVDRSGLASDLANIRTNLGRCAMDAAVAALAARSPAPQPGASASAPMAVDSAQILSVYTEVRSELGWPSGRSPGGSP
jgi:hypothetical protein